MPQHAGRKEWLARHQSLPFLPNLYMLNFTEELVVSKRFKHVSGLHIPILNLDGCPRLFVCEGSLRVSVLMV